ncbi:MAG TPA: ABC transporter permease [Planctomycetota bacterium]|nr:ABC transporter permease [Planctomycetota bacterium]
MFNNPEFVRLYRTKLRGRSLMMLALSSCLIFGLMLAVMQYNIDNRTELYLSYFFTTIGLQCGIGSLYALILASQNITLERERNTYDFQRLVAMGPWRLGFGKLLGAACEAYVGLAVAGVFAFIPVLAGVVPGLIWFKSQLVVLVFTTMVSSFGLLASSVTMKTAHASGITVFLMFIMLSTIGFGIMRSGNAIWFSANPSRVFAEFHAEITQASYVPPRFTFFGGWIPLMAAFLLINLSATALFFVLTVRRLIDEELSYLRPKHAVATFIIFEVLVLGSSWDIYTYQSQQSGLLATFHAVNLVLLILLAFGLTSSAELLRGRISRGGPNDHWKITLERANPLQDSPPVMAMILFGAAYAVLALGLTLSVGLLTGPSLAAIVMIASSGVATAGLLLYTNVFLEKGGLRIAAVIIGAAFAIPPMFVSYFVVEKITAISPIAWLVYFGISADMDKSPGGYIRVSEIPSPYTCPGLCLALAILLVTLSAMRIRFLLDMDQAQRKREKATAESAGKDEHVLRVEANRALLGAAQAQPGEQTENETTKT